MISSVYFSSLTVDSFEAVKRVRGTESATTAQAKWRAPSPSEKSKICGWFSVSLWPNLSWPNQTFTIKLFPMPAYYSLSVQSSGAAGRSRTGEAGKTSGWTGDESGRAGEFRGHCSRGKNSYTNTCKWIDWMRVQHSYSPQGFILVYTLHPLVTVEVTDQKDQKWSAVAQHNIQMSVQLDWAFSHAS